MSRFIPALRGAAEIVLGKKAAGPGAVCRFSCVDRASVGTRDAIIGICSFERLCRQPACAHSNLAHASLPEARVELAESKQHFEQQLEVVVRHSRFCKSVLNVRSSIEDAGMFLPVWTEVRR